jgi:dTDP-glucose 4,6-dehydratase
MQVRDWLYVEDHCRGIDLVLRRGAPGEVYNLGGGNERHNLHVVQRILDLLGRPRDLIEHVVDRPGHDVRYAIDSSKLLDLGWDRSRSFEDALEATVRWYVGNESWWRPIKQGTDYVEYFHRNYRERAPQSA